MNPQIVVYGADPEAAVTVKQLLVDAITGWCISHLFGNAEGHCYGDDTSQSCYDHCKEIVHVVSEQFVENGGCTECFGIGEAGHKPGCHVGRLEAENEQLQLRVAALTEALQTWHELDVHLAECPECDGEDMPCERFSELWGIAAEKTRTALGIPVGT